MSQGLAPSAPLMLPAAAHGQMEPKPGPFMHPSAQDMNFNSTAHMWKDNAYGEYFDLYASEEHYRYKSQMTPMLNGNYASHLDLDVRNMPKSSDELFSLGAFLVPGSMASKAPAASSTPEMQQSSCMYSSAETGPTTSTHTSPTSSTGTSGYSTLDTSRGSCNESYLPNGHVSPTVESQPPYAADASSNRHVFDDFEVDDPSDIFLDQPLNKDCVVAAKMAEALQGDQSPEKSGPTQMDLSALLGLPSISSFLDEEQAAREKRKKRNEHVDKIMRLNLNCSFSEGKAPELGHGAMAEEELSRENGSLPPSRGGSSPSLIELQPLSTSPKPLTPGLRQDSPCPGQEKSAFQPYAEHSYQSKDALSTPNFMDGNKMPYSEAFNCLDQFDSFSHSGPHSIYRNAINATL